MHQYTADLANRMVRAGHRVQLVTTGRYPEHRYLPDIEARTPVNNRTTGFSPEGLQLDSARAVIDVAQSLQPDLVHLTGPHLWNVLILRALREAGVPVMHTLHDLDPHPGTPFGPLIRLWNRWVIQLADHILVHASRYRRRLLERGIPPARVTCTPLLHLFLGHIWLNTVVDLADDVVYERCVLFFGRMERYKGIDHLITAWAMMDGVEAPEAPRLILAGPGALDDVWTGPLPAGIEVRNDLIDDEEALALFRRCGLLVLPYIGATQSALIPAAYFFRKPVMAAPSGALDEYVEHGETGWVIEPEHPPSLARCLTAALEDRERLIKMGEAGYRWYEDRRRAEEATLLRTYRQLAASS
jgi:glycosyltransferase involved in cell wall biosynthesis